MDYMQKAYENITNIAPDDLTKMLTELGYKTALPTYKIVDLIKNPDELANMPYKIVKMLALTKCETPVIPVRYYKAMQNGEQVIYKASQNIGSMYCDALLHKYAKAFDLQIIIDPVEQKRLDNALTVMFDRVYDFIHDHYVYIIYNKSNKRQIFNKFMAFDPTGVHIQIGRDINEVFDNLINRKMINITRSTSSRLLNAMQDNDFKDIAFGFTIKYPATITEFEDEALLRQERDTITPAPHNLDAYMEKYYGAKLI